MQSCVEPQGKAQRPFCGLQRCVPQTIGAVVWLQSGERGLGGGVVGVVATGPWMEPGCGGGGLYWFPPGTDCCWLPERPPQEDASKPSESAQKSKRRSGRGRSIKLSLAKRSAEGKPDHGDFVSGSLQQRKPSS